MSLRSILSGTGVAIVTPFAKESTIDFIALNTIIEKMIANGVEYIITLGTTGETPTLSKEEKKDIIQFTYETVNNRVPIVVGIGGNDTASLVKDLNYFPLEKATAVLSASPYYNKPSQNGLFQHYQTLAAASPKPIILYNVPGRTGRNMTAATTIKLANEVANIGGIKEAHNDMEQCMELLRDRPEHFLIVTGDDALSLPQISCGMDGVISVAANAFPKEFSDMVRFCLQGNFEKARPLHYRLLQAYHLLFAENNPAGVKAFMYEKGWLNNVLRLPVTPVSESLQLEIKKFLFEFEHQS